MNERYEILGQLAEGGRGTVFRARDRESGREVAIKRVRADQMERNSAAVQTLIHEARQMALLHHPNIVQVHDSGVDDEGGFIVMELVAGETLEDVIMRGALSLEDFDSLVRQVLGGMMAAHEQGVIHLDLKPGNIMIHRQPDGGLQAKILDFGQAQTPQSEESRPAGAVGSVYFMAPEQFERTAVDARTDIYALGCLFYYALTQKYPFDGETAPQVMVSHLYNRTQPLAGLRPDLPAPTVQWIEWLIRRLPSERPASLVQAWQAYEDRPNQA